MRKPTHDRKELPLPMLIEHAGETPVQPPPPAGGIPKQWLPGFLRWPIRVLVTPFVVIDRFTQRIAAWAVRTPFKRAGSCKRRGNCCFFVLMPEPKGLLPRLFYLWHTQVNGFYWRGHTTESEEGDTFHVMGCRYLQKNGSCGHYRLRPGICREWPLIEIWGAPRILKGCGYRAEPRSPVAEKP